MIIQEQCFTYQAGFGIKFSYLRAYKFRNFKFQNFSLRNQKVHQSIKLFLNDISTKLFFLIPLVYINQSYLAFGHLNYLRL